MSLYENIDQQIRTFVDNNMKYKISDEKKNEIVKNLHPLDIDINSVIIYTIGFIIFISAWYFLGADSYLTKKTYWVKPTVFTLYIVILLLNMWLSTERPGSYNDELEIQRSIEDIAFRLSAGSLALALFTMSLKNIFKFKDKKSTNLPFLFLSFAFIFSNLILLYINLPKLGIFVHYYRNIISTFLNLSVTYIIASMIYVIALIRKA